MQKDLEQHFSPEFINRLDRVIVFNPLTAKHLERIVRLQVTRFIDRVREQGIVLSVTSGARKHLAEQSHKPKQGARAVRRTIQELLETPLANILLERSGKQKVRVTAKMRKGVIAFDSVERD